LVDALTTVTPVRRRAPWAALAGVLAASLADVAFDPSQRHVPLCPFHAVTGWWCPLCGGLRAADALVHGRFAAAVHDNALLVLALPVLAGLWTVWLRRSRTGRAGPVVGRGAVLAVVAVLVAFTLLRNLPFAGALRP
jgi:hypothetical protein